MSGAGYLTQEINKKSNPTLTNRLTAGRVIDTNDPQQMGRVRAFCPGFGDTDTQAVGQIPWAAYVSPLGGITTYGERGPSKDPIVGPTAYGMWNIPKIGAYVLVGCIDGDASLRFYVGCFHPQYMAHTMPHGRYTWNDQTNGLPDGPLDTTEKPIEPLYRKLTDHFTKKGAKHAPETPTDPRRNLEWRTRGVDVQTAAITNVHVNHELDGPGSKIADHEWGNFQFTTVTEENGQQYTVKGAGYGIDQQEPDDQYDYTGGTNYDSLTYSWTTPGFHSISMNDRSEQARIRIRTTTGHQIIMDDTNERIYINTSGGETWIELDNVGNIDIYAAKNISTHAGGDINFFADGTFRVQAQKGIHMQTHNECRIHSYSDLHIRAEHNIRLHSGLSAFLQADERFHIYSKSTLYLSSSGSNIDLYSSECMHLSAGNEMHLGSGGNMYLTGGPEIHLNGPAAEAAASASIAAEKQAFWTSRVPEHEPWARVFMKASYADNDAGNSHVPEYPYTSLEVGKGSAERGETYQRGELWHR